VTSQINHATPASFAAHNEYRRNYNEIADSYFDDKVNGQFVLDVMLGGGWEYFIREERNLVDEFKQAGYQYIDNLAGLNNVTANTPLLGLFGDSGMPWALDTPNNTRLPLLTKAAIAQLENSQGFFLLVEASQVDWAGHGNDIAGAMAEMHDMALTLEWLEQYVVDHPDTLVVVTADHSTGGLSIAANKDYRWEPDWIKNLQASPDTIGEQLAASPKPLPLAEKLLGFSLNPQERKSLQAQEESDADDWIKKVKSIIDRRTNTGWTTSGHTAIDVQIFAMGHSKALFQGHMDNTQIPKIVFSLMEPK
jgi:alkaline phosphatase